MSRRAPTAASRTAVRRRAVAALIASVVVAAAPAGARVLGGGPVATDCLAVWEGVTATAGATSVVCQDGDPECDADGARDGACTFGVTACFAQDDVAGCAPATVERVAIAKRLSRAGGVVLSPLVLPPTPIAEPACGTAAIVRLPLRGRARPKPSRRFAMRMRAKAGVPGRAGRDMDTLTLRCVPNAGGGLCPENAAGGPSEVRLVVAASGTDLDNGWNGLAHNFAFVSDTTLRQCLTGCDGSTAPACAAFGETGPGTINGPTFGPPLPTLVGGVATCLVNRYDGPVTGTANVATGDIEFDMPLRTEVWVASSDVVCPQCSGREVGDTGICQSGPDRGRSCRVEGTVPLRAGNTETFRLSSSCRPDGTRVATLTVRIKGSTGQRALAGPLPCGGQLRDDACGSGGTCTVTCTGAACVATRPDPADPTTPVCVDAKGGISQRCCSNDTARPCFPSANGGTIERTGVATPPEPPWPAPTWPKTADTVLVDTYCEPATGENVLDAVTTGLPGPGAAVLPMRACWTRDGTCP